MKRMVVTMTTTTTMTTTMMMIMNGHQLVVSWENQNLLRQRKLKHQALQYCSRNEHLWRVQLQQKLVLIRTLIESVHRHTTEKLVVTVHIARIVKGEIVAEIP